MCLKRKEFRWSVPNDDNRAFEGKNIRDRFLEELDIDYDEDFMDEPCSMLELIIGLACRCEEIMYMQPVTNRDMHHWFWMLLENAELTAFDDDGWKKDKDDFLVDCLLNKIIDRTYNKNGYGGLFPMKKSRKDQRKVELWYQMNVYLVENYYTDEVSV
jgi:hypothetical protein